MEKGSKRQIKQIYMNELHRVFYHELGHFIAHELNSKLFGGHRTKSINLKPYPPNPEFYVGEAKIEVEDENGNYVPSRDELPGYLASSTYGCILQACYTGENLKQAQDKNGDDDLKKWYGALMQHDLQDNNADIHSMDLQYIEELRKKNTLSEFMKLDPEHYLMEKGDGVFVVDLERLRKDTEVMIANHQPFYANLIDEYDAIFRNPTSL